jgi:hypothetical protein
MYVLLVSVIAIATLQPGQNQGQSGNPTNQGTQHKNSAAKESSSAKETSTPASETASIKKKESGDRETKPFMSHSEWVMAGLTFIYVCATIFYVCISRQTFIAIRKQGRLMKRQLGHMGQAREQTEKMIESAKESAGAATKSAQFAEKAARLTERADVLLDAAGIVNDERGRLGPHSRVSITIRNFGRTRAVNSKIDVRLVVAGAPDTLANPLPETVLGAGSSQTITFSTFGSCLTQNIFGDIFTGKAAMHIEGTISYEDVFGDKHTTKINALFNHEFRVFVVVHNKAD